MIKLTTIKTYPVLFCILFCAGCSSLNQLTEKEPPLNAAGIFLTESNLAQSYAYQVYQHQYQDEMAKIRYLINVLRFSDKVFLRNGESFPGGKAASWLEYKLYKFPEEAETARDFIQNLAGYSKNTGLVYEIAFGDNRKYALKDLLLNELEKLENLQPEVKGEETFKAALEEKVPAKSFESPETPLFSPFPAFSPKLNYTAHDPSAKTRSA